MTSCGDRLIEEVRGDDPELASYLRIEEREFDAGGRNKPNEMIRRSPRLFDPSWLYLLLASTCFGMVR
jgi:hypothetical protein